MDNQEPGEKIRMDLFCLGVRFDPLALGLVIGGPPVS